MIHELDGDILLSEAQVIAHGVSPNDDFHQGLALQLREGMPEMYKDFRHHCKTMHPKPGELMAWKAGDGRLLVHLFTQEPAYDHGSKPGRATLSHVNHALHALRALVIKEVPASVALPRLACGVGGLEWQDVRPLIDRQLGNLGIPIYVYVNYHAKKKAREPR
jgi:O-acetyl-ADP-ribose deacetylase (regulator of RNase III)